jgi:hypothetical protein
MSIQNLANKSGGAFLVMAAVLAVGQFALAQSTNRNPSAGQAHSSIQNAESFSGATADEQINAAISALNGKGGIVDVRAIAGAQTISRTIMIPANTLVQLGPSVVFTCTVASAPCWKLTGQGAKLLGGTLGVTIGSFAPSTQTGTILRMGPGITSTTDMIAINPNATPYAGIGGFEVGNFTIDFAQTNPARYTGRYCVVGYAINHSWVHDVNCYNPGVNGMEFENTANGWSYDNRLDNVFVQAAGNNGFNWTTVPGSGFSDFDRWTCDRCKAAVGTVTDGKKQFSGVNGFALTTGTGVYQTIADFVFTNLWAGGTAPGGNAGFYMNQTGTGTTPYIENIYVFGEIEQQSGCACGTAEKISNAGSPFSVQDIIFDVINDNTGFWHSPNNFSAENAVNYQIRQLMQGIILPVTSLPTSATRYPYNGIVYQTPGGSFEWIPLSDGTLHMVRTDAGPIDTFTLDLRNKRFMPSSDDSANLGAANQRWNTVYAEQFSTGTAKWTSGAGEPRGACAVGSLYTNTSATTTGTVLYVCGPASAWRAVPVQ